MANYKCNSCGNIFEVKASIKDKETKKFKCSKCGSEETKEKFSLKNLFKSDDCGCSCSCQKK